MESDNTNFNPRESLELIDQVIRESKYKYEENGIVIMQWGLAVMIAGIAQFAFIRMGHGAISKWVWLFTMVPMFIYTVAMGIKENKERSKVSPKSEDPSGLVWFLAGTMGMLTGFVFGSKFGAAFTTAMFLPFCVAAMSTALTIRKKEFVYLTILGSILSYAALYVKFSYHPLFVAAIACVLFFIPGLMLRSDYKKRHNV